MAAEKSSKAKRPAKKDSPQVMDVSKPGKTPPSSSSRPIIVGHKPMAQDPMVSSQSTPVSPDEDAGEKITVSRISPKVIKPLSSDPNVTGQPAEKPSAPPLKSDGKPSQDKAPVNRGSAMAAVTELQPAPSKVAEEEAQEEAEPEPEIEEKATTPEPPKPSEPEEDKAEDSGATAGKEADAAVEPEDNQTDASSEPAADTAKSADTEQPTPDQPSGNDAAVVDAVAEQASSRKNKSGQTAEDIKKQAEIEKLVEDKTYFVPIGQVSHRRHTRWMIALLLLVLMVAGAYLALDAQVIKNDIKLPYELIQETTELGDAEEPAPQSAVPANEQESEDNQATPAGAARDTERKDDLDAIAAQLEAYYVTNETYPTLTQINDEEFRIANLKGTDREAFKDPEGSAYTLLAGPTAGAYAYETTPNGCDADATPCASFTLSATLEDDSVYEKNSSN